MMMMMMMMMMMKKKIMMMMIIYLSISGPTTAVAVFRNPKTIPFCLTTDLL
jgi:hypothetical protein